MQKSQGVRLSPHIIPIKYSLTLKPNLEAFTFEGSEAITIEIKKSTNQITLHSKQLEIESVQCQGQRAKIKYDKKAETASFIFPKPLKKGKIELKLDFKGVLNDQMRGFYRSRYMHEGKTKHLAVSQFEPTDARKAFPCFDEPAKKAIFKVELVIPKLTTAISNTEAELISEHESGYKIVRFSESPKMSTYLLAFIVGEFEHIEAQTKSGIKVRVHTTHGKIFQAKFALDCAVKTLEFYNKYFDIPYPLPSLDMVALPDFAAGAMENWGAVTYRESALLVDPQNSSIQNKQWTALVIGHELAHQWFGNLVTMDWWTHLWLNEGFASYIEYLAVDNLFPKWRIWEQFSVNDLGAALKLDALASTHPIEVEVGHPGEISEIFDAVSYSKGAAVIRMLAEFLGEKDFRNGLRIYLKKHSYGNAVTRDLWAALEKSSGRPVARIMKNWTAKPGYPVLDLSYNGGRIRVSQSRFFSSPVSEMQNKEKTLWKIPAKITVGGVSSSILMVKKTEQFGKNTFKNPWIKLNAGETSLCRTRYSPALLQKLTGPIFSKQLPAIDRLGIIRDAFALSEAGKMPLAQVLKLAGSYVKENDYNVWAELVWGLGQVDQLFCGLPQYELFRQFARTLLIRAVKEAGWKKNKNEQHGNTLLRSLLLAQAGKYGDALVIAQAKNFFWGNNPVDPDIRSAVYLTVARYGGNKSYNELLRRYRSETLHEERNRLSRALGFSANKRLLQKTLKFSISGEVRPQDAPGIFSSVFANPFGRQPAWDFFKKNFSLLLKRYGQGGHLMVRFISPLENFNSPQKAKEVGLFFKSHPIPGAERAVKQALEKITSNALWLKRDGEKAEKFLIGQS